MNGDVPDTIPNRAELEADYERRRPAYHSVLEDFERLLQEKLEAGGLHPTIKGRVKDFDSYYRKKIRLLRQARQGGLDRAIPITDLLGLRVVCPFLGDLDKAVKLLQASFKVSEVDHKGAERSFREFGYESIHLLIELPQSLGAARAGLDVKTCEVQLRTILQEAWAEVEHELVYKARFNPFDQPMKRKLAALNANLSLSDIIFQEIRDYQGRLMVELDLRRDDFYSKIEGAIDAPFALEASTGSSAPDKLGIVLGAPAQEPQAEEGQSPGASSLDDLLLQALYVHNRGHYAEAIRIYTALLESSPPKEVQAVLHKHRGMAFFSESRYEEAIADFGEALCFDPGCYKAAYFRGVVRSVLEDYSAALKDYDLSLAINPFQTFTLYRRAQVYWHLGDYPKVLADCEAALRLNPEHEQSLRLKSLAQERLGT